MYIRSLRLLVILILIGSVNSFSQNYLSNLDATKNDPIYTTYAASLSRSEYKINEGYQFVWYDPEKSMSFESIQAGELGVVYKLNGLIKYRLSQFYKKPVITTSYSDVVKYYYYPFKNVKVESTFLVYSSQIAIREIKITNESAFEIRLDVYPFIKISDRDFTEIKELKNGVQFNHEEYPDGWMKDHNIPFQGNITDVLLINEMPDGKGSYNLFFTQQDSANNIFLNDAKNSSLEKKINEFGVKIISLQKSLTIPAGKSITLKVIRGINEAGKDISPLITECENLFLENLEKYVKEDEEIYSKIPRINFNGKDYNALYWNAFSLLRQCMQPPEGECHYDYYVFSREPRWGWGYGGQVFHESLSMLAYVFMDPMGGIPGGPVLVN